MKNISMLMFYAILIIGALMTISSGTWIGMWMGLEMNMIAFIPILYKKNNTPSAESCMIYFLIQSLSSITMLMSVISTKITSLSLEWTEHFFKMILFFSLLIKSGIPPFHFWYPEILEKMKWVNCVILMTWQKIAPLSIISFIIDMINTLPMFVMITVMVGAIGGLNQTSIRKIMSYSSISHSGWMLSCMKMSDMWIKYMFIYTIILSMMIIMLNVYSSYYINQLTNVPPTITEKMLIITMFMSLGGMPPFLGFLPKWMVIQNLVTSNSYMMMMTMMLSVLITLFYYLRLTSPILLFNNSSLKYKNSNTLNLKLQIMMLTMNLSLPFMVMMVM